MIIARQLLHHHDGTSTRADADWRAAAACAGEDPEAMFPARTDIVGIAYAKSMCARCPVVRECRAAADELETGGYVWGVWGGLTPDERRRARGLPVPRYSDRCGTYTGYKRHHNRGGEPCEDCRAAKSEYNHQLRVQRTVREAA
ncbi:WhiB family transcriptional regulator [Streptomyces sp. JJ66]|uniref:WhiB family transcriptional regulator n=1 Tax=Streptomyces sp. JJ66 TaxID=2803843 RepID=UPI001C596A53|nr:WhiB family transcriptional regulator [Streptomyces sp. JJ66]MBW1603436.1 WhiB family transcriptional regulator [Streptomyces sp. JJ66]